jgi:hypothetical protein
MGDYEDLTQAAPFARHMLRTSRNVSCLAVRHLVCDICGHIYLAHDDDESIGGCLACLVAVFARGPLQVALGGGWKSVCQEFVPRSL